MYSIPSAQVPNPRPRHQLSSGRADNACTNLLGFFVRYVRTRGTAEIAGSATLPISSLPRAARTCHAWLARLTRARRGGSEGGRRESSLLTFGILRLGDAVQRWLRHPEPSSWSYKSTIKEKYLYVSSLSEFFSLVRKERKGQKEESIPLLISFCRLAATGANKVP